MTTSVSAFTIACVSARASTGASTLHRSGCGQVYRPRARPIPRLSNNHYIVEFWTPLLDKRLRISVDHSLPLNWPTLSHFVPLFACSSLSGMVSTSALAFTSIIVSASVRAYASTSVSRSVSSNTSASKSRRVSSSATPFTSPRQCLSGWPFTLPIVSLRVQSPAFLPCQPACRPVPWHPRRPLCSLVFWSPPL